MLKIKITNAKQFFGYLKAFGVLIDELTFSVTPEGLRFAFMDPSRVAMFDVTFGFNTFSSYECNEKQQFAINITNLLGVMRLVKDDSALELSLLSGNKNMTLTLRNSIDHVFTVPILEPEPDIPGLPKVELKAKMSMLTKQLLEIIKAAQIVSDHGFISTTAEAFTMRAKGDSLKVQTVLSKDQLNNTLESETNQKSCYSLSYLQEAVELMSEVSDTVTISLTTDMPICLDFKLKAPGSIKFWLAPRITTEED